MSHRQASHLVSALSTSSVNEQRQRKGTHMDASARPDASAWPDGPVLDAARPDQIEAFVAAVGDRHGRLSVLVNSAGIQRYGTAESTPVEVWDEVLDVN